VARLAGVPGEITKRAKEVLAELEGKRAAGGVRSAKAGEPESANLSFADAAADEIKEALRKTDINTLTPIEALNLIYEWKRML
jgi:DNA mismatch repair protein MutS